MKKLFSGTTGTTVRVLSAVAFVLLSSTVLGQSVTLRYDDKNNPNGVGTFTVPPCVTSITVQAWGAGGGGGYRLSNGTTGGYGNSGGGGGAYETATYNNLTPGQSFTYTIGEGGSGGQQVITNGINIKDGKNTTFGSLIAQGGKGSNNETVENDASTYGNGGIASAVGKSGGKGGNAGKDNKKIDFGGGGGGAGYPFIDNANNGIGGIGQIKNGGRSSTGDLLGGKGGDGGTSTSNSGQKGFGFGGGGGGALKFTTGSPIGGDGAHGGIVITMTGTNFIQLKNDITGDWATTSNWVGNSVPSSTSCVYIPSTSVVTVGINTAAAKNVTIASGGKLIINTNQSLTVQNEIINNNTGNDNLIVQSDANLVQINETKTNSGLGGATVYRNSEVPSTQYNYWSSPVSGQNLYGFYDGNMVPANKVMTYNTATDYFTAVPSGTFTKGVGYSVKGPASGVSNAAFKGFLNNGNFTYTLATTGQKYNLIGNPFASNLNLKTFYADNSANVDPTFYFWDFTNNTVLDQQGGTYTTTYHNHNYAIFNAASGTGTKAPNATKKPNGIVKVSQGFIAQATTNTLYFKNSQRTKEVTLNLTDDAPYYGKSQNVEMDRFWLKMTTPVGLFNSLAVVYLPNASNTFDAYDSEIVASTSDNLYSFSDNTKVAINGRADFKNSDLVKLGTSHFVNGPYTISIDEKEGVFNDSQSIYLKDKLTGTITNLSQSSYTYEANKGETNARFEIVYKPENVLVTDSKVKDAIVVYHDSDHFVVKAPKIIATVEVYDLPGKMITVLKANSNQAVLNAAFFTKGMYVLRIKTIDGEITNKKIVKQ